MREKQRERGVRGVYAKDKMFVKIEKGGTWGIALLDRR